MDGNVNPIIVDLSLKRLRERLVFLREKMVLLQNFDKVSGGYPRRDLGLDVIPEQQLEGTALDLSERTPWEVPGESRNFHGSDRHFVTCLRQF